MRKSESRSRCLQLVGLSALHRFKVCARLRTLVGVNGIVSFDLPVSKNHSSQVRTYPAVVGSPAVKSITGARIQDFSKSTLQNSSRVWNAGLGGHSEKV